jgi:hypothetical protein
MPMRHAISKDYRQFEDAVREFHAEMVRASNDLLLPVSTEWFVGSWISWFNLAVRPADAAGTALV